MNKLPSRVQAAVGFVLESPGAPVIRLLAREQTVGAPRRRIVRVCHKSDAPRRWHVTQPLPCILEMPHAAEAVHNANILPKCQLGATLNCSHASEGGIARPAPSTVLMRGNQPVHDWRAPSPRTAKMGSLRVPDNDHDIGSTTVESPGI
jgi:hypothetical protein